MGKGDGRKDQLKVNYRAINQAVVQTRNLKKNTGTDPGQEVAKLCFVCSSSSILIQSNEVEGPTPEDLDVLLKDIIELPDYVIQKQWKIFGPPQNWVPLCSPCLGMVRERRRLKEEIESLEEKWKNCKDSVVNTIRSSFREGGEAGATQQQALHIVQKYVLNRIYNVVPRKPKKQTKKVFLRHLRYPFLDTTGGSSKQVLTPSPDLPIGQHFLFQEGNEEEEVPVDLNEIKQGSVQIIEGVQSNLRQTESAGQFFNQVGVMANQTETNQLNSGPPAASTSKAYLTPAKWKLAALRGSSRNSRGQRNPRYSCPDCPKVKNYSINRFVQHLGIHRRRPYKCTICSDLLPANEQLQNQHWTGKHSDKKGLILVKFIKMKLNPGDIWKCGGCYKRFSRYKLRHEHEEGCLSFITKAEKTEMEEKKITCNSSASCVEKFRDRQEWRLHRFLLHPEIDSVSCLYCDESFQLDDNGGRDNVKLFEHLKREHSKEIQHEDGNIHAECEGCGTVFISNSKTESEEASQNVHHCKICHVTYISSGQLRRHMKTTHPNEPFDEDTPLKKRKIDEENNQPTFLGEDLVSTGASEIKIEPEMTDESEFVAAEFAEAVIKYEF